MRTYSEIATEVDFRSSPEPVLLTAMFLAILLSSFPDLLPGDRQLPFGLVFMALPLLAWATVSRWPRPGRWLTVVMVVLFCHVLALWSLLPGAWAVVILPLIIGAALTGFAGAIVAAALECGLLLLSWQWAVLAPATPGAILLLMILAVLACLFLIYRPLDQFARWSWDHYRQAQKLLDEARDRQVELKQALSDLADANVQLDRLNRLAQGLREVAEDPRRAKEQFVANLSHELRTPLNMVVGFSQMMLRSPRVYGATLPPALLSDLNVILRNSQHLSSLIDDVLDLSQIEAGRMALMKERVVLSRVVEAACTAVRPLYESKRLALDVSVAADLPAVFCDQVRMREVLLNLLSNAGRFTESGGVSVRVWQERDSVLFSVADTGPGIADEHKERIFRPFEQVDGSLRRTHGGSGLGLSISKAFVELHGGQMWFESEVGRGTTFFIRLPVDPPLQIGRDVATRWLQPGWEFRQRTRTSLAPKPAAPPRFIILEAGASLQALVSRYIDDAETIHAPTLDAACAEFQRAPAQALLINSTSLSGSETVQEIYNAHKLPPGLPAIACSIPSSQEAASALGVAGYLMKPVSQEQLLKAIDQLGVRVRTILVVDDEPDAQQLFHRMLAAAQRRYRILRAGSGREALAILRGQHVDVALVDMVMPEMDGLQLIEEMQHDESLRGTTVVAVTGRDPAGHMIASPTLSVTTAQGLSAVQLLAAIQQISELLSAVQARDPGPRVAQPG